jgi:hypothetical protein
VPLAVDPNFLVVKVPQTRSEDLLELTVNTSPGRDQFVEVFIKLITDHSETSKTSKALDSRAQSKPYRHDRARGGESSRDCKPGPSLKNDKFFT